MSYPESLLSGRPCCPFPGCVFTSFESFPRRSGREPCSGVSFFPSATERRRVSERSTCRYLLSLAVTAIRHSSANAKQTCFIVPLSTVISAHRFAAFYAPTNRYRSPDGEKCMITTPKSPRRSMESRKLKKNKRLATAISFCN